MKTKLKRYRDEDEVKKVEIRIGRLVLLLALACTAALLLMPTQAYAAVAVSIGDITASPNQTVTVPITVSDVTNLGGGEVNVSFDPSVVRVTEVTEGDMSIGADNHDNTHGWVYINAYSTSGLTGNKVFANVCLQAVGAEDATSSLDIVVDDLFNTGYNGISHTINNGGFTVNSQPVSKIVFVTEPQTIVADAPSAVMTVQTRDTSDNIANVPGNTVVQLSSTSGTGSFSISNTSWSPTTSVTIPVNENATSFYYKDTATGTPTITASESPDAGWTDATQQQHIIHEPPSVTNPSATPDTILNVNGRARPYDADTAAALKVTVTETEGRSILTVTIDLSPIGYSSVQPMEQITGTDIWTVTVNSSGGTGKENDLEVTATDEYGNSNTSVCIQLTVLKRGDVGGDNFVSLKDIAYIARYMALLEPEWSNPPSVMVGDVVGMEGDATGDGTVNMMDALYIARYRVGLEDEP